jgi:hypothetical protein
MTKAETVEAVGSPRPDRSLVFVTLAIGAIIAAIAFNPAVFNDGDTSWHIAAGQWILRHHAVPMTDPFSFTFAGAPWHAHEWLAEVIMAALFAIGGWTALAVMTTAAMAVLLLIIGRDAIRFLKPVPAVATVVGVALVLMPFIVARPHVLAWPIFAAWIVLLLDAREKKRAPPLPAALLMIVWANLHASFLLGLAIAGYFALEALVYDDNRARVLKEWGLFGLASLAACLVAPHPVSGLLYPLQVSQMQSLPLIGEWRATDLRQSPAFAVALAAAAATAIALRSRISPLRLLLLAGLAYLAMKHARHQPVFIIVAALVLIRGLGHSRAPAASDGPALWKAGVIVFAAIAAVRAAIPVERPDSESNPLSAIAHIPPQLRDEPVLNSYAFGGPLILAGIRPYIDGRGDMYGDAFMFEHQRLMRGDMQNFRRAAMRRRIKWTIISPLDPLSRSLDREPGWRRIYADRWAVIHVAD